MCSGRLDGIAEGSAIVQLNRLEQGGVDCRADRVNQKTHLRRFLCVTAAWVVAGLKVVRIANKNPYRPVFRTHGRTSDYTGFFLLPQGDGAGWGQYLVKHAVLRQKS